MKTFKDIKFKPHTSGDGLMGKIFFPNGYGISVVRFRLPSLPSLPTFRNGYGSYTRNETEWEAAVLIGDEKKFSLTHDTPITDDVIGYMSEEDVTGTMRQIQELPNRIVAAQVSDTTSGE